MLLISVVTIWSMITLSPFGPPNGQGGDDPTGVQIAGLTSCHHYLSGMSELHPGLQHHFLQYIHR